MIIRFLRRLKLSRPPELRSGILFISFGIISGASVQLNRLVANSHPDETSIAVLLRQVTLGAITFPILLWAIRKIIRRIIERSALPASVRENYKKYDTITYAVFVLTVFGAIGIQFSLPIAVMIIFIFLVVQLFLLYFLMGTQDRITIFSSLEWLTFLFLISGFAALIYQIVWQRSLFTAFGVNIESVTVIVSIFMFGLGIGSIGGGILSKRFPLALLQLFLIFEVFIGICGIISLPLIRTISDVAVRSSILKLSLAMFALLCIPTMLMGATLPILVTHLHRCFRNIGKSVGILYFTNTAGSAIACFVTAAFLFVFFGQQVCVIVAASCNFLVGVLVYRYAKRLSKNKVSCKTQRRLCLAEGNSVRGSDDMTICEDWKAECSSLRREDVCNLFDQTRNGFHNTSAQSGEGRQMVHFLILLLSGIIGYVSLSQEIIWIRVLSFVTGGKPDVFAFTLGFFLFGIACSSLIAEKVCEKGKIHPLIFIAAMLTISPVTYYFSIPISSKLLTISADISAFYLSVGITAFLVGGIFPMLCHFGIKSRASVGFSLSWIYFANIIGSTAGPLLTGFMLLDFLTLDQNILYLSVIMFSLAGIIWIAAPIPRKSRVILLGGIVFVMTAMLFVHNVAYSQIFEKLHYKTIYSEKKPFKYIIQNRVGIIAVESSKTDIVYGGGVYDGQFNIDPVLNTNGIRRAYIIAALHPAPKEVLEIGLSSGSWARVIANHARVRKITDVEINPGYIELIKNYPEIATVLYDPKVTVCIDDGRRWLNRHPEAKFDVIVWNASFHWRNYATNTLSEEFLRLCKKHLKTGGVIYYNTTGSKDILFTAAHVFRFVTWYDSFVAASDSPFAMTNAEKRSNILRFQSLGRPIFAEDNAALQRVIEELIAADLSDKANLIRKKTGLWQITDDNMATEFKRGNKWYDPETTWAKLFKRSWTFHNEQHGLRTIL